MSFEDDEYWEDEYNEYSLMPKSAVIQERQYQRRTAPDPVIPTKRPDSEEAPVDELAARRQRRAAGNAPPQRSFDSQRPSWLDDPDFAPVDTSAANLAGDDYADVDFNRPELGADFDAPDFPISSTGDAPRRDDRFGDYPDDIDEPFDHRDLEAYGHEPPPAPRTARVEDEVEKPARKGWLRGRRSGKAKEAQPQPDRYGEQAGRARVPAPDEAPGRYRRDDEEAPRDERRRWGSRSASRQAEPVEADDRKRTRGDGRDTDPRVRRPADGDDRAARAGRAEVDGRRRPVEADDRAAGRAEVDGRRRPVDGDRAAGRADVDGRARRPVDGDDRLAGRADVDGRGRPAGPSGRAEVDSRGPRPVDGDRAAGRAEVDSRGPRPVDGDRAAGRAEVDSRGPRPVDGERAAGRAEVDSRGRPAGPAGRAEVDGRGRRPVDGDADNRMRRPADGDGRPGRAPVEGTDPRRRPGDGPVDPRARRGGPASRPGERVSEWDPAGDTRAPRSAGADDRARRPGGDPLYQAGEFDGRISDRRRARRVDGVPPITAIGDFDKGFRPVGDAGRDAGGDQQTGWDDGGQAGWSGDERGTRAGAEQETWSGDGQEAWSGDGQETWSGDGQETWSGDGQEDQSGDRQETWSGDGQEDQSGDGQETWSGDGQRTWAGAENEAWASDDEGWITGDETGGSEGEALAARHQAGGPQVDGRDEARPSDQQGDRRARPGDGPRVLSKAPPPTQPRVISRTEAPPAPRVVKKSEPGTAPRVVGSNPATPAARVVSPPPVAPAPSGPGAGPRKPAPATAGDRDGRRPADGAGQDRRPAGPRPDGPRVAGTDQRPAPGTPSETSSRLGAQYPAAAGQQPGGSPSETSSRLGTPYPADPRGAEQQRPPGSPSETSSRLAAPYPAGPGQQRPTGPGGSPSETSSRMAAPYPPGTRAPGDQRQGGSPSETSSRLAAPYLPGPDQQRRGGPGDTNTRLGAPGQQRPAGPGGSPSETSSRLAAPDQQRPGDTSSRLGTPYPPGTDPRQGGSPSETSSRMAAPYPPGTRGPGDQRQGGSPSETSSRLAAPYPAGPDQQRPGDTNTRMAAPYPPGTRGPGDQRQGGSPSETSSRLAAPGTRGADPRQGGSPADTSSRLGTPYPPGADPRQGGAPGDTSSRLYPPGARGADPRQGGSPSETNSRLTSPYPRGGEGFDGPPRPRRSPRTAHVILSEGDGPWSMVPDEAPPPPLPVSGLSRPISPDAPRPPMDPHRPVVAGGEVRPGPVPQGGQRADMPPAAYAPAPGADPRQATPLLPAAVHGPAAPGADPRQAAPLPPAAVHGPAAPPVVPGQGSSAGHPPAGPGSVPPGAEGHSRQPAAYPPGAQPAGPASYPPGAQPAGPASHPAGAQPARPAAYPAGPQPAGPAAYPAGPQPEGPTGQPGGPQSAGRAAPYPAGSQPAAYAAGPAGGATGLQRPESDADHPPSAAPYTQGGGGVARRPEAVPVSPASGRPTVPVSTPPAGRGDAPRGVPAQRADKPVVGADPGRSAGARSAEDEPTVRQAAAPLRQAAQAFGPDGRDPEAYAPPQPGTDSSRRGADGPGHRSGSIAVPAPRPPADPARAGAGQPPAAPQAPADRSARHGAAGAPTPARHGTASDPAAATRHGINDDPTVATRRGTAEPAAGDDPTVASPLPQRTARHGTAADPAAPADRPARHGTPEDPAAAQDGYGAHAQPYMDADGTLHNLRPIGRLVVSGPDQPAARPADTEFGGKWFAPKPEDEAAADPGSGTADGGPEGRRDGLADDRTDGLAEDRTDGLAQDRANGFAEDRTNGFSEDRTDGFSGDRADGFSGDRADERHDDGAVAEFAPASGGSDGLVIDLDLTGLLNGMAITAEEGEPVGSPQPEPAETDAARRSLIPGPEPKLDQRAAERKPPDRTLTLSAADLEAIRWRLDGGTLREVVDDREALRELGERLDGPLSDETDNVAKASLLSVRAEVYRLLGELGMAAAASRLALAHAESSRNTQSLVIAEAELAHVLRLRGDFQEADRLFAKATAAPAPDALLSVVHENAGRCCFDQGRHMEALDHFARAVRLGHPEDQELAERVGVCLEAVYIHVLRDGWGPYPRDSYELLGTERPPGVPAPAGGTFPGPVAERLAI